MNKKYSLTNGSILKGFIILQFHCSLEACFSNYMVLLIFYLLEIFLVKMTQPLLAPVVFLLPA